MQNICTTVFYIRFFLVSILLYQKHCKISAFLREVDWNDLWEKVRRLRKKECWLDSGRTGKLSGLSLRTIISYEKGESILEKRSTYDVLAEIFEIPSVELRSEI